MLQSLNVQDVFWPIPGLISCTGVTGSVGITLEHWSREYSEVGSNPTWGISLKRREIEPSQVASCRLALSLMSLRDVIMYTSTLSYQYQCVFKI